VGFHSFGKESCGLLEVLNLGTDGK
jgi:hypothetical protein